MNGDDPTPWEVVRAVEILRRSGAVIVLGASGRSVRLFSRPEAAVMLSVSLTWLKEHERVEFPRRLKIPGGEVRYTLKDIEEALERWRQAAGGGSNGRLTAPGLGNPVSRTEEA